MKFGVQLGLPAFWQVFKTIIIYILHTYHNHILIFFFLGPGALFGALAMGVVAKFCFPFDWSWSLSCILGVILCPTDPVG